MASRRENKQRGFTLLEVIIALAIMTLAFASILAIESGSIDATIKAKQLNIVAMLARNKMVETEYAIQGKSFDEFKKEDEGKFKAPYEDYRWTTTVKEITFPSLNAGGAKQGGGGQDAGGQMTDLITKLISNYLSKAVREVTVTIFWKRSKGEQSFSVSTYWVDLNHEFALSE